MKYGRWVIRSKEKRSDSDAFTLLVYLFATGLFVSIGYAKWAGDQYEMLADQFNLPMVAGFSEMEQIESDGQFELPPSALVIRVLRHGFFDTSIGVVFDMESNHYEAFIDSTLCYRPGSVARDPDYLIREWEIQEPDVVECYVENQNVVQFVVMRPLDSERVRILIIVQKQ
ncbi:MAG: hypothetical protein HYZ26_14300 [Chloroflexi bacterium]|nr:hypothetical protein [Chloroflexota bacterium]